MVSSMADRGPARGSSDDPADRSKITRENLALRRLVAVYRHLSGLALQDADIATVARLIAERTDATVAVVGPRMNVLAAAAPEETGEPAARHVEDFVVHPRLGEVLSATAKARRALRFPDVEATASVIVAPILVGDDVPAYLITLDSGEQEAEEDTRLLLTEHAATICGVILGRERVVAAAASRARDDLVEGLLSGRGQEEGEVDRWARHLGYDPARDHHVLSVAFAVPKIEADGARTAGLRQRVAEATERFFCARAPDAINAIRADEVAVVLPEADDGSRASQLGVLCADRLGELFPEVVVTIGIGGSCRAPVEVARSYAEARRTVETVRRMQRASRVVAFDDLGIHRLLLQVPELAELRGFAADVLGKLSGPERESRSEYLATLACYFRENNSPQRASRKLHVHPNTVTYRIRRVEEITGLDLGSYRDRLMAQVALEILGAVGDTP